MNRNLPKILFLLKRWGARRLVALAAIMGGATLLEIAGVGLFLPVVQIVLDPARIAGHRWYPVLSETLGLRTPQDLLLWAVGGLFVFFLGKNVVLMVLFHLRNAIIFGRLAYWQELVFAAYLSKPYTFHAGRNSSLLHQNVQLSIPHIFNAGVLSFMTLVTEALFLVASVILLLVVEPLITLLAFGISGGAAAIFHAIVKRRLIACGERGHLIEGRAMVWLRQSFGAIREIKVLQRDDYFVERYRDLAEAQSANIQTRELILRAPTHLNEVVLVAMVTLIVGIAAVVKGSGASAIPLLSFFGVAAFRILPAVTRITASLQQMDGATAAMESVFNDLYAVLKDGPVERPAAKPLRVTRSVELDDVWFTHPGAEQPSLRGISVSLARGESIGIVGPSGAGKSTLVDVLLGLLHPERGALSVDGQPLHGNLAGWQRCIGYVPQSIYLIDDTLRRNIAFGVADHMIDASRLAEAIRLARLDDVVAALPDGLDTMVGENAIRLSGGQRQRIGIARALYHDPDVLVLDEATSALDSITEREVTEAVRSLAGTKTQIVVAHRLSTVAACDRLLLLENGRLVASGSYDHLLRTSPLFRQMAEQAAVPQAGG